MRDKEVGGVFLPTRMAHAAPNTALALVPSDITYHGFERRHIEGIRTSVIIKYVTSEWRGREQLAFPDRPV